MARARQGLPSALMACVFAAGCSAAGVPISEPEHLVPLATGASLSQVEAIAWSIRDVIDLAVRSLLRAAPGDVTEQLTAAGTMTLAGTATQPSPTAETLSLGVTYDGYEPKIDAAVPYTDWRLSSGTLPPATLTIDFTEEPTANNELGFIGGTFDGSLLVARAKSQDAVETVDARLSIAGQLKADSAGKVAWQVVHISGVIHSPASGYYYNDASFPGPSH